MTAANTKAGGMSFLGCDPMIPVSACNIADNSAGQPNISNYFCCAGNEQNLATIRTTTQDIGSILGVGSGTNSGKMDPMQGSEKYFIQGLPATRLGDMSLTNCGNAATTQLCPSQTKYFINV